MTDDLLARALAETVEIPVEHDWSFRADDREGGYNRYGRNRSDQTLIDLCRSLAERTVDDFLTARGIAHVPEPAYPGSNRRADWGLPDGTFVEYAGLLSDAGYRAKIAAKRSLAAEAGCPSSSSSRKTSPISRALCGFRSPAPRPP